MYLSSADWMPRNLDRRVEVLFPVEQEDAKQKIIDVVELMLSDNIKMRIQQSDGTYKKLEKKGKRINSQEKLFKQARSVRQKEIMAPDVMFKPKTKI